MSHFFTMAHRKGMGVFLVVTIPKIIILGRVGPENPEKPPERIFQCFRQLWKYVYTLINYGFKFKVFLFLLILLSVRLTWFNIFIPFVILSVRSDSFDFNLR